MARACSVECSLKLVRHESEKIEKKKTERKKRQLRRIHNWSEKRRDRLTDISESGTSICLASDVENQQQQ
jgi:hypothetical protein